MTTDNPNSNPDRGGHEAGHNAGRAPRGRAGVVGTVMGYVPTVLVFAAIGGIAYWGHHTGWQAPKFSQIAGAKPVAEEEDWCVEHNVPDSRCIKCHPELVGGNVKDWCPEHGLPESKCTICHPEILTTGVAGDWCPEHGVPESSCTLCHPEIAVKGAAPASLTGATVSSDPAATQSSASPATRSAAAPAAIAAALDGTATATTKPGKDPKTCQTHAMRVQFASADAVRKAGVRLAQVVERPMSASLTANAEVGYNRNRLAQVSSPVSGKVWRVDREIGQPVKQGEVIALIDSADVGRAKANLLKAIAEHELKVQTLKRLRTSSESGFRTEAELREAEAAMKAASIEVFNTQQALINLGLSATVGDMSQLPERRNIQFMGLSKSLAEQLDPKTTTANLLPLVAPFDGIVIERHVVAGEVTEPSKPLFAIADTSRMWVTADIPLAESRRVSMGQTVTFRPDGSPDQAATGTVSWISTAVDDQTRTVKVRADAENPDGRLLANTFGKADITIRETASAIAVPNEAIQWEGCCYIAFVRLTGDIFQTRKVKLGAKVNGFTEVLIGLLPGEVVATEGSYVLKSELLKSALGAGCTDH